MLGFCCGSLPGRWGLAVMRFQAGPIVELEGGFNSSCWGHAFDVTRCYYQVCQLHFTRYI